MRTKNVIFFPFFRTLMGMNILNFFVVKRVAKLIGDKRAVVAERGFNRPYSKVVVTNCGLVG